MLFNKGGSSKQWVTNSINLMECRKFSAPPASRVQRVSPSRVACPASLARLVHFSYLLNFQKLGTTRSAPATRAHLLTITANEDGPISVFDNSKWRLLLAKNAPFSTPVLHRFDKYSISHKRKPQGTSGGMLSQKILISKCSIFSPTLLKIQREL